MGPVLTACAFASFVVEWDSSWQRDDLVRRSVAAMMCAGGHFAGLQLVRIPAAGDVRGAAGTVERPGFPRSVRQRHQIRAIAIRTEPDQVPRTAPRTLHAMA